ncbi:MAG: hypothetical protein JSS65_00320 [Armatimonadetes bacterium]|nr:hypothetical protein [Armatimonadota bacterium]
MNRFDWQAYEDGSMDAATRQAADQLLAGSESARAELQSLRALRESLRTAALAEPVPVEKLQSALKSVCQKQTAVRRRFYWSGAGLAAAALIVAFLVDQSKPRIADVAGPALATNTSVTQPKEVRSWLVKETGMPVPEIRLAGLQTASISGASHGRDWVAWNVDYHGAKYKIYGRQCRDWFTKAREVNDYLKPMFVDGRHVGWYCAAGMAYVVMGGTEEGRYEIARKACLETPSAMMSDHNDSRQSL